MTPEEILIQFAIVIVASLIVSVIVPIMFFTVLKGALSSSLSSFTSRLISDEMKKKASDWLQEVVKNGISEALKDEDVKKMVIGILELTRKIITDKFIKDDEEEKIGGDR
jgi:Na+-translocating ferredoxin:NAD+ oxidoreductase RnfG subunit